MPDTAVSARYERFEAAILPQPVLLTDRLCLRPLSRSDRPAIERLADDPDIAHWCSAIPHPLPRAAASSWIAASFAERQRGEAVTYAIERRLGRQFMGGISLSLAGDQGTIGYWLGRPHWNRGYATEALRRILTFGFEMFGLGDISAYTMPDNAASLRVQAKAGMIDQGEVDHVDGDMVRHCRIQAPSWPRR
jgi:RimJ/RimL family protein N-acetyltransferase